ncbi:FEKKY domain-containing protein [Kaistella montana]
MGTFNLESHGCVISNEIINQIARSNTEAENNLTLKYGSDWKEKFLKEVDYAYNIEKKSQK